MLRKVGKVLLLCSTGLLGVVVLLMLAVTLALERAPQYQAQIKEWVHARIGYQIAFASLAPAFRWYGPEVYFSQLELRSKDGTRVLARAAGGRVGADVWQFVRSGKLFAGRIELDSPVISIERIAPERFMLASEIPLGADNGSLPTLNLADLPAGTLAIRHGLITIRNWNTRLPQLELRDVSFNLRHGERRIALTVDAQLPALLGGAVSFDAAARGSGPLANLSWTARLRSHELSLAGFRQLVPEALGRMGSGTAGFELTARGHAAFLEQADMDFNARNVTTQLTNEPLVRFDEIAGTFTVTHAVDRWTLLGRRVRALRAGHRDPESEFAVNWRGDAGLLELHAKAAYLRAETLLPLVGLLPQQDLRERLQDLAPSGEWMDMSVDLARAALTEEWGFEVRARFRDLGFAALSRAPGLRGLNGTLSGNQSGGRVDIDSHKGVFLWPTQFPQALALEHFKTTLYWKRTPDELLVATPSIELKTRDAAVRAQVAWRRPADGSSALLTLVSTVTNANVANTRLYLPKLSIAPSAWTWLNRAFVVGHLAHAEVVIQGPLRQYPFRDGSGLFLARASIDGLTLDYKEGWPVAENLALLAEFRNEGLAVKLSSGHIGSLKIVAGVARFVDFKTAELELHATVSGDAADALAYLRATPVDAAAEHVFSTVEAKGPLSADVELFMPFKDFEHRHTLVHAHLHGVTLNKRGSTLMASELTGDADVDGAQVSRAEVHGKVLGGAFQMQARAPLNRPVTRTLMVFNGTVSGDALHAQLALPASVSVRGSSDWHGVLRLAPEPVRERSLRISGSLAGLELNLPAPLAKPVGQALPSSMEIQWLSGAAQRVSVTLGSVLRSQFTLDTTADGLKLGRLALSFGAPANASAEPPPFSDSQIVNSGGAIERLDLAGWLKLYTPDKSAKPLGNFLRSAKFDVAQIDYLGLSFLDVSVDLALSDAGSRIGLSGPNVVGSITLPGTESSEPWKLEFQRLKFFSEVPDSQAQERLNAAAGQPATAANPHGIPALDFHAAELIWGARRFGDVQASLGKLNDGISLKKININGADFTVRAQGEWRGKDSGVARVEGTLASTDVGATLKDLGYDAVIEAKTAKLEFDLSWLGAPSAEALSLASGHVQAALERGQLTSIKPGAGRVVGLASLAALPRRLEGDFSDLTDKGLAFDTVRGDFDLRDGSAFTDNVLVKGPAAEIGLIGRVGLKNKDYDQTAVVTGNVNSSLPLAAFVAGPIVGGAVLLFTQVFKQPLKGLVRGYYRITGGWDNPTVERIKSADAAAASAEATK